MLRRNMRSPRLPPDKQQHFTIAMPYETHYEVGTCEDVDCPNFLFGWKTIVPNDGELAVLVRSNRKLWSWKEEVTPDGMVKFEFGPGQRCFLYYARKHIAPTGRDPLFYHKRPVKSYQLKPQEFNNEYNEQIYLLNREIQKG